MDAITERLAVIKEWTKGCKVIATHTSKRFNEFYVLQLSGGNYQFIKFFYIGKTLHPNVMCEKPNLEDVAVFILSTIE